MSWETKTGDSIIFLSPELNSFTALIKGGERSGSKKLGVFDPPNFRGSIIQDMDTKSIPYPITCYFDGFNHIDDGKKFFEALQKEKGVWDIGHPIYGSLSLQLVDFKQVNDATGDAAVTTFETSWLEPAKIDSLISSDELGALTLLSVLDAISDGINQLQQLRSDLYAAVQGALNMINTITGLSDSIMAELAATQNLINDSWNQAKNTLASAKTEFQSDPLNTDNLSTLGNALVDVVSIPLEVSTDYAVRIKYYEELNDQLSAQKPTGITPVDFNKALFYELGKVAILISTSRIITTSDFKTRTEVLAAMEKVTMLYNDIINDLDIIQEAFI